MVAETIQALSMIATTWSCHIFATLLPRRKIFSLEAPQLLTKSDFDDIMVSS